jgi:hypothetical protein
MVTVEIAEPTERLSEHLHGKPAGWPVSSLELLLEDRGR